MLGGVLLLLGGLMNLASELVELVGLLLEKADQASNIVVHPAPGPLFWPHAWPTLSRGHSPGRYHHRQRIIGALLLPATSLVVSVCCMGVYLASSFLIAVLYFPVEFYTKSLLPKSYLCTIGNR